MNRYADTALWTTGAGSIQRINWARHLRRTNFIAIRSNRRSEGAICSILSCSAAMPSGEAADQIPEVPIGVEVRNGHAARHQPDRPVLHVRDVPISPVSIDNDEPAARPQNTGGLGQYNVLAGRVAECLDHEDQIRRSVLEL